MSSTPATSGGKPDSPAPVPGDMGTSDAKGTFSMLAWLRSCWKWWALFFIVTGILFFRQPAAIRHPGFYAEDGCFFFSEEYEAGFARVLFAHYAGYLHFAPRIGAALCATFVPLEHIPEAYAVLCLFCAAGVLTFFYSKLFRPVIRSDELRAVVVLAFTLMPNSDSLMRLSYLCWYLQFFIALLTVCELPKNQLGRWFLFMIAAIGIWSAPLAIICLPLILLRAWLAMDRGERVWWSTLAMLMVGYWFTMEKAPEGLWAALHEPGWGLALLHAETYRVFCYFFLGQALVQSWPASGWMTVVLPGLLLAGICVAATFIVAKKPCLRDRQSVTPWILLYYVFGASALFILRPQWVPGFLVWARDSWYLHERYFFTSTLLLCVLCGLVCERSWGARWRAWGGRAQAVTVVCFLGWLGLHAPRYRLLDWRGPQSWKHYARLIRAAEARVLQTGHDEAVHVEICFSIFDFDVFISPTAAARDHVWWMKNDSPPSVDQVKADGKKG